MLANRRRPLAVSEIASLQRSLSRSSRATSPAFSISPSLGRERGAVNRRQIGLPPHRRARMLLQHGEHAPAGVIEPVGAQTLVERPRAPRQDLTEMEEEMVLEPERPGSALPRLSRALQQASSVALDRTAN